MGHTPPKFDPARKNVRVGPQKLPKGGRKGPTPEWPLPGGQSADEKQLWKELWATPQAVAWEQLEWTRAVARYARIALEAEQRKAPVMTRAEARQMEDKLGLTPKAMRMLLWEVVGDEVEQARQASDVASARDRIKAVG